MSNIESQKQQAIELHSAQADMFAARYAEAAQDVYKDCFLYSRHRLDALLRRYLPERGDGLRLLDVGCGTGHHLARLRQRGYEIAGIDGSAEMLRYARMNNPGADLRLADVDRLPFPDGCFDLILCIEVLRYLPDASGCIGEMARVLKPGGICLVTAAPRFSLNAYWVVNRIVQLIPVGNLVRLKQFFTTSAQLRRQFLEAGFQTVNVHGVYLGPINWVQRLAPRLLPRLLRAWEPHDATLADHALLREFSNMFLVHAVRGR